ncbi:MAG: hypothetical protein CL779_00565 [Chloroflexi bacterium]|nr:hypothetical protein [Chloroflexota bacterium]|tara:strand:+ start:2509 stop:3240 length:732 start_codon:yes stop_codon:yes gene_type:complete
MNKLNIVHLYPDLLNLYADQGNIRTLEHYAKKINIEINVSHVSLDEKFPDLCDLIIIGGGQDKEQKKVAKDLLRHSDKITKLIDNNIPALAVCGGYQLFGKSYKISDELTLEGLGIFDCVSIASTGVENRLTGDVLLRTGDKFGTIVGFENHSARTYLGSTANPLGSIVSGFGNNGVDGTEGIMYKNAIGTYLHGPILPRNEKLTLFLLKKSLINFSIDLDKFEMIQEPASANAFLHAKRILL